MSVGKLVGQLRRTKIRLHRGRQDDDIHKHKVSSDWEMLRKKRICLKSQAHIIRFQVRIRPANWIILHLQMYCYHPSAAMNLD